MKIGNLISWLSKKSNALVFAALFLLPSVANAVSIDLNTTVRTDAFDTYARGRVASSYDHGLAVDFMSAFAPYVGDDMLAFGAINGPINFSGQLVLEIAGWANLNDFGVLDANNNFVTLVDGAAVVGATYSVTLGDGTYTLAGRNGSNQIWSSIDANNVDAGVGGVAAGVHLVGQLVEKDGTVALTRVNGLAYSTVQLYAGDYVVYFEDLDARYRTDNDWNDGVFIIRGSAVPEPTSVALLASGLFGLVLRRRVRA